jgi:hypothetical protein
MRREAVCLPYTHPLLNIDLSSWEYHKLLSLKSFQEKRKASEELSVTLKHPKIETFNFDSIKTS